MSVIDYSWDYNVEDFTLDLDFFNEKDQEDKMWQARTGLNHETLCGAIETIIFMSDKPVTLQKIKNHIDSDLPLRVIHESISRLQVEYEQKHHGIRLMEVAQGYQFRTKATYSKIIQSMYKVNTIQLSPTALEVLAIIAYKQPISKTTIESIRGVDSSHIVRALMDKRLVTITGRSDEVGRPSLYGTTNDFLEIFNLSDIDQLPSEYELEELATATNLASISEIKDVVTKGDKGRFDFDELAELDALTESIKLIASDTTFTNELKEQEKRRSDEEGYVKKTAFDILEEYLFKGEIIEQNRIAVDSDTVTSLINPKVVNVTESDKLFNTPVDEDEDFVDALDTLEVEFEEDLGDEDYTQDEDYVPMNPSELNPQELADALDDAFDNLFGSVDAEEAVQAEHDDADNADLVNEKLHGMEGKSSEISDLAKDLDLDLDFLRESLDEDSKQEDL